MDLLVSDGLSDPTTGERMGDQAEKLALTHGITRKELDEVALLSQERATSATQQGFLAKEIVPIEVKGKKGMEWVEKDEGIRFDTSLEKLSSLKPVFQPDGVFTAGNSSQISDGAAALLLASQKAVDDYGLQPIARILKGTWAGGEAWRYPEVPILAVKKLLEKLKIEYC